MNQELQKAQDLLNAALSQRTESMNALVQASADNAGLRRRIAELEQDVAGLREELAKAKAHQAAAEVVEEERAAA